MSISLSATVITYHPTEVCLKNILTYYDYVSEIFLVDNTENENLGFIGSLKAYPKITIIKNNSNVGIGEALNWAVKLAIEKNYEFVLTMDQDSFFSDNQIKQYLNCFQNLDTSTLGMVGVNYMDNPEDIPTKVCEASEVTHLITSGSILTVNAFKKLKGFNEDLFIDGVDHEYCLKLILSNFKVLSFQNIYLTHNLGNLKEVKSFGFGKIVLRNTHSPLRLYYITRNYLYLNKVYKSKFPEFCSSLRKEILLKLKNGLLYEKYKLKYVSHYLQGIRDFRKGKFGKIK